MFRPSIKPSRICGDGSLEIPGPPHRTLKTWTPLLGRDTLGGRMLFEKFKTMRGKSYVSRKQPGRRHSSNSYRLIVELLWPYSRCDPEGPIRAHLSPKSHRKHGLRETTFWSKPCAHRGLNTAHYKACWSHRCPSRHAMLNLRHHILSSASSYRPDTALSRSS